MTECFPEYVQTRSDLLERVPKGGVLAELGVFKGDFARQILNICEPKKLHLIDRWEGEIECGDKDGKNIERYPGGIVYPTVKVRFNSDHRVVIHRASTSIMWDFPPSTFDFVYIDADHYGPAVIHDLMAAENALTIKGMIAGHDYTPRFPDVITGVDSFCRTRGWTKVLLTRDGCPSYLLQRV